MGRALANITVAEKWRRRIVTLLPDVARELTRLSKEEWVALVHLPTHGGRLVPLANASDPAKLRLGFSVGIMNRAAIVFDEKTRTAYVAAARLDSPEGIAAKIFKKLLPSNAYRRKLRQEKLPKVSLRVRRLLGRIDESEDKEIVFDREAKCWMIGPWKVARRTVDELIVMALIKKTYSGDALDGYALSQDGKEVLRNPSHEPKMIKVMRDG